MNFNEIAENIHGEIVSYLDSRSPEDVQDIVRYIADWLRGKGMSPMSWKKGTTGLGTTMFTFKMKDEEGNMQWLAFDDEAGVGDFTMGDNEPNPASYS